MTDTTHKAPDLLPCPFCGCKDYRIEAGGQLWRGVKGYSDPQFFHLYHNGRIPSGDGFQTCTVAIRARTEDECFAAWNTRSDDLVQAAVAAKLREAADIAMRYHADALEWAKKVRGLEDHIGETDTFKVAQDILALITPDAQAALDRVVAAERERGFWAGRSCGGSKAEIDAALATIPKGGE